MVKQKKKRNKTYSGSGASVTRPTITKVSAVNRGRVGQWWYDNKRIAKPALVASGVIALIVVIIFEAFRLAQLG
jgi:hypothetical protein